MLPGPVRGLEFSSVPGPWIRTGKGYTWNHLRNEFNCSPFQQVTVNQLLKVGQKQSSTPEFFWFRGSLSKLYLFMLVYRFFRSVKVIMIWLDQFTIKKHRPRCNFRFYNLDKLIKNMICQNCIFLHYHVN